MASSGRLSVLRRSLFLFLCLLALGALTLLVVFRPANRASGDRGVPVVEDPAVPLLAPDPDQSSEELAARAGEAERKELGRPALSGRLVSDAGFPVPEASVSWVALEPLDLEWEPAWQRDDWGALERATLWTTSDEEGRFRFDQAPDGGSSTGSVVWATHSDHEAACLLFSAGEGPAGEERILRMHPSPAMLVRVEDDAHRPVSGAVIRQYGTTPTNALPETEERARRYLARTISVEASGPIRVGSFPGEQVLVAEKGDLLSVPWRGERRDEIVLRLVQRFSVGGQVALPDWSYLDYAGERRIVIAAQLGNVWHELASLRGVQAGPWGPLGIPVIDSANYRVRLEGSPIIPVVQEFAAPEPGAHLTFDLRAELGSPVWVHPIDEEGNPVWTAEATASWRAGSRIDFVTRRTQADGRIGLWSVPPGTFFVTTGAPGYVTEVSESFQAPLEYYIEFVLRRGGRLRGRCLHDGSPVEDFEIALWRVDNEWDRQTHRFRGRIDGSFEVDGAPLGEVRVTASAAAWVGRGPLSAKVGADSPAEVILELFDPIVGNGVVVDERTAELVPGAEVQAHVRTDGLALIPWGLPVATRQDGSFEIAGLVPGSNTLAFRAAGYSEKLQTVFVGGEAQVDLGRVALGRPQDLELQLTAEGVASSQVDFGVFHAKSNVEPVLPETPFDADGKVRFSDQRSGSRMIVVDRPEGGWSRLTLDLRSGEKWMFTHRVLGARRLTLEIVSEREEDLEKAEALIVYYRDSNGIPTERGVALPTEGVVTLEGIDAESVSVDVLDGEWRTFASGQGSFQGRSELHLAIPLGGEPFLFRIVDHEGVPVPNARVYVSETIPSSLLLAGTTDEAGECRMHGVPEKPVLVHVVHPSRGARHGIPCDGSQGEAELVLESNARLALLFRDGLDPVGSVECRLVNINGEAMTHARNADAQGLLSWEGLSAGKYRVSASHPDCWPLVFEAEAEEDAGPRITQIRRLGDLSVGVRSASGLPVSGLEVALRSLELEHDVAAWISEGRVRSEGGLVTDNRGKIQITGLPNGRYEWSATVPSGEVLQGEAAVPPSGVGTITIEVP